jgi:hypothetical protein
MNTVRDPFVRRSLDCNHTLSCLLEFSKVLVNRDTTQGEALRLYVFCPTLLHISQPDAATGRYRGWDCLWPRRRPLMSPHDPLLPSTGQAMKGLK